MSRVGVLNRVGRENADRVDGQLLQSSSFGGHGLNLQDSRGKKASDAISAAETAPAAFFRTLELPSLPQCQSWRGKKYGDVVGRGARHARRYQYDSDDRRAAGPD